MYSKALEGSIFKHVLFVSLSDLSVFSHSIYYPQYFSLIYIVIYIYIFSVFPFCFDLSLSLFSDSLLMTVIIY